MTPLAHKVARELTLPKKRRTFSDEAGILPIMGEIHCFEVSEVIDIWQPMANHIRRCGSLQTETTFLPAPKTWIEIKYPGDTRYAWLLQELPNGDKPSVAATATLICEGGGQSPTPGYDYAFASAEKHGVLQLGKTNLVPLWMDGKIASEKGAASLYAILAIINSPRVVGRRQHAPHRGLERSLVHAGVVSGRFPLHAWTEILLSVEPPQDYSYSEPFEDHLTGKRALHFCRAHLRVKMGRLEIVKAHWRGDASIGIKRSRYKMAA